MNSPAFSRRAALAAPLLACLVYAGLLLPQGAAAATTGSGVASTQTRSVGDFQAVALSGSMNLVVRQGATAVQVQADDNLVGLIETLVEPGGNGPTLVVRWKRGEQAQTRSKVMVTVSTPKLLAASVAGSGDVRIDSFTTPSLKVALSGSGDIQLQALSTDDLGVSVSGSGDVGGSGKAGKLRISVAGGGDVTLSDLRADDVVVRVAGSGDVAVHAARTLDVSIAGSGDVVYTGNATVTKSVAGSGSVRKR